MMRWSKFLKKFIQEIVASIIKARGCSSRSFRLLWPTIEADVMSLSEDVKYVRSTTIEL